MSSDPDVVVVLPVTSDPTESSDGDASESSGESSSGGSSDSSSDNSGDGSSGESSDDGSGDSQSDDGESSPPDRNWLDWLLVAVGAAIVLGVVGFLGYQILTLPDEPASLVVTLGESEVVQGTTRIDVTVENDGSKVAEAAVIEVCAGPDDCAQVSFTYVPQGSTREGSVGLPNPLPGPLETRVVSYRTP